MRKRHLSHDLCILYISELYDQDNEQSRLPVADCCLLSSSSHQRSVSKGPSTVFETMPMDRCPKETQTIFVRSIHDWRSHANTRSSFCPRSIRLWVPNTATEISTRFHEPRLRIELERQAYCLAGSDAHVAFAPRPLLECIKPHELRGDRSYGAGPLPWFYP